MQIDFIFRFKYLNTTATRNPCKILYLKTVNSEYILIQLEGIGWKDGEGDQRLIFKEVPFKACW